MKVQPGAIAPALMGAADQHGHPVALGDAAGKHVLLVFLRYASCPMCLLHIRELSRRHRELASAGIDVIAVFHSPPRRIARHTARMALPFRVIANPGFTLYKQYGVVSSWLRLAASVFAPSFYAGFVHAAMLGFWGGAVDGDAARMPADFLIGPDGTVLASHYGRGIDDHLSVDAVLQIAGTLTPAVAEVA
jgi:peroxiredoxin